MKKIIGIITCCSFLLASTYAEESQGKYKNEVSYNSDFSQALGFGPDDAMNASIATSMLGWGLGMAVVIGLASALISTSSGETSHAHCCD